MPRAQAKTFEIVNKTQEEEDAVDLTAIRYNPNRKPSGEIGSIAHIIKGALGAGILSVHAAYRYGGLYMGLPIHIFIGTYMSWCLYTVVKCGNIISRRTNIGVLSYPDIGEASFLNASCTSLKKYARFFRHFMVITIMTDLFGSCCCYQLIIANTIKQLVEDTTVIQIEPTKEGYPQLRVYMAIMIIPFICICMVRYLKYLAPFSMAGNFIILLILGMTFYYSVKINMDNEVPITHNCTLIGSPADLFTFVGMVNFSVSCSGIIVDVCSNMKRPNKYTFVIFTGMTFNTFATCCTGFFGYCAFKGLSASPITNNFPMNTLNKVLRVLIAGMIYATHALNFFVPFTLAYTYIEKKIKDENLVKYEYMWRAIICTMVSLTAIVFPSIEALMGFIGCFCLSNMGFIWPNLIELIVVWVRPGLGPGRWKLWRNIVMLIIGLFLWSAGSVVSFKKLLTVVTGNK